MTDFTREFVSRGVKVNGDLYSLADFSSLVSKHCRNLTILNYNESRKSLINSNPYIFFGSMTCIGYRGKCIGISTRHQVDASGSEAKNVGWNEYCKDKPTVHFGPEKIVFDNLYDPNISDQRNFYLYDFTNGEVQNRSAFEESFFQLTDETILYDEEADTAVHYLVCGYLDQDQSALDFKTLQEIQGPVSMKRRQIWCRHDFNPMNRHLGRCKQDSFLNEDLNLMGIQGGPVFATVMEDNSLVAKFAGVLIETNAWLEKRFEFIKASKLRSFLDHIVNMQSGPETPLFREGEKVSLSIYSVLAVIICENMDVDSFLDCKVTVSKDDPKSGDIKKAVSILKDWGVKIEIKQLNKGNNRGVVSVNPATFPENLSRTRKGKRYLVFVHDNNPVATL